MGASVFDLCKQQRISLLELTDKTGLEFDRVHAIYLGRWTPSPNERERIAEVFGKKLEDIAWGHTTPIQHIYGSGPG